MDKLLGLRDVLAQTSLGKSALYAHIRRGNFPQPVPVALRRSAWRQSEVQEWIAQRIAQRDEKKARAEVRALDT